jgi:c-di-GMP-binding flagellar brake protein YcgR
VIELPKVNQLVLVQVGESVTLLRSRIEDSVPDCLTIAYPSDGLTAHRLPLGAEVKLEWLVERGLGAVEGAVRSHVDIGVPAIEIALTSEPVAFQRREHARADLVLELEVWPPEPDGPGDPVSGITLDVSGGGLRAVIPFEFDPGSLVRIAVDLPDGQPVEALARVVAQRDEGVVAFKFDEIVPADRERLIRSVFASYRISAAVRRPT